MRPRDSIKAENIRKKALEMLVIEGLDAFSMQKLARSAGVSPATLYIYYEDREDLLYQLWLEQFQALSGIVLEDFDPAASFEAGLWIQWRNRIRFFREHPLEWRFLEQVMHSAAHDKYQAKAENPIGDSMGTFVGNAIQRGELTDFGMGGAESSDYPREVLWALLFAPLYALLHACAGASGAVPASPSQKDIELAFKCVVRGLRPEPAR